MSEPDDLGNGRDKPRPIENALLRYEPWQIFGFVALVSAFAAIGADELGGPIWIVAMGTTWSLFGGAYVVLHFAWKRFKEWRYPTYYDN